MAAVASMTTTGCIEETFPEEGAATQEQVGASATALESSLRGIPTQMSQGYFVYGDQVHETDMSYAGLIIAQTEMLGDMYVGKGANTGYDWYSNYNNFSRSYNDNSYFSYLPWFSLYKLVKGCNDVIGAVDIENASSSVKEVAGKAYAYRALDYFTLMYLFEPKKNKYTDCSKVLGLTVPFVLPTTTLEQGQNNPRVPHDEMVQFILSDLTIAEECLANNVQDDKLYPSLACVYGLKARVYMWDEDYENAAKYARLAIDTHGQSPTTEAQWLDVNTGFNTAVQSWMWKMGYSAENMGNLCNWTGWMSSEAAWGYSDLTMPSIDRSLYDHINYSDFRKYTFLDPDRSVYDYKSCRGKEWLAEKPEYVSLKFRCKGGDYSTYTIGALADIPLMRVEEFYFIEAEAIAQTRGYAEGVKLLNSFMTQYRDPEYNCKAKDLREFQLENLMQMRIEFWGEGVAFPMAKRIAPGIMQNYEGTNAPGDAFKINCEGIKPNWNLVIPRFEYESNPILEKTNNPDPTQAVVGPSPVGEYS